MFFYVATNSPTGYFYMIFIYVKIHVYDRSNVLGKKTSVCDIKDFAPAAFSVFVRGKLIPKGGG